MIKFVRRLWNDRRGNALLIAGAALPIVVGAAGLATDTIQWTLWKRELQRAADSAAFAGAYANIQQNASKTAAQAVTDDLAATKDNHTIVSILSGYPKVTYPTDPKWSYAVHVELAVQQKLGFSSIFMSAAPIIKTSATAAYVDEGVFCMGALKTSGGAGIKLSGSGTTKLGCGAIANSNSKPAVDDNGAAHSFQAPVVAAVGSLPSSIKGTDSLEPYHAPIPDPFAGKYDTTAPTTCNGKIKNNVTSYGPGCYTDFSFAGNSSYTLSPGVYYLNNTDFATQGGTTITGTGVTIILTGTSPGSVKINANSTVQLIAPTDPTSAYYKMLFIQATNATTDNTNTISGSNASYFDGAMYFPNGNVTFSGSSATTTQCVMVIAYTVTITGNSEFQNVLQHPDGSPCQADDQAHLKEVRLVA